MGGSSPSTLRPPRPTKGVVDCPICTSTLVDSKTLPCGHSFCGPNSEGKCLIKLERSQNRQGEIGCPMCQRVHQVQAENVPSPFGFEEILESMAKMRVCERHNNELKYYCYDHKEELCDTCWREKHVDHKIELIELFQWRQLSPAWERRELAELRSFCLEQVESLSQGIDYLLDRKDRYIKIADLCLSLHQKQHKIDSQFKNKQVDRADMNIAEFDLYLQHITEESKKLEQDMAMLAEMSAELDRLTRETANELKKRLAVETTEYVPTSPSTSTAQLVENNPERKQTIPVTTDVPFTSTVPTVTDSVAANVPSVQSSRTDQDSYSEDIPTYGHCGLEFSGDTDYVTSFLNRPLRSFTPPTVSDRVATNVPSEQSNIPAPTDTIIAFGQSGTNEIWRNGTNKWTKWEKGRDCGRWYACVKAHSNIYIIGGRRWGEWYSPDTDLYDIAREQWSMGPQLKVGRRCAAACFDVYNSQILVIGGASNSIWLNSVERLKVDEQGRPIGEWEQIKSMKSKRRWCAIALLDDQLFVSGGFTTKRKDTVTATVEMLDLRNAYAEWEKCASMREARGDHAMIAFNNQLFVFGGWNGTNTLTSCERYCPVNNTWQKISNMRVPRNKCGVCLMGDKIYVVGDHLGNYEDKKTVEVYNPDRDQWTEGPQLTKSIGKIQCVSW